MRRDDIDNIDFNTYRVWDDDPRVKQGEEEIEAKLLTVEQKIEKLQREMCLLIGEKQSLYDEKRWVHRRLQEEELEAFKEDLVEEFHLRDRFPPEQLNRLLERAGFPDESGEYMSYNPEVLHDDLKKALNFLEDFT